MREGFSGPPSPMLRRDMQETATRLAGATVEKVQNKFKQQLVGFTYFDFTRVMNCVAGVHILNLYIEHLLAMRAAIKELLPAIRSGDMVRIAAAATLMEEYLAGRNIVGDPYNTAMALAGKGAGEMVAAADTPDATPGETVTGRISRLELDTLDVTEVEMEA